MIYQKPETVNPLAWSYVWWCHLVSPGIPSGAGDPAACTCSSAVAPPIPWGQNGAKPPDQVL